MRKFIFALSTVFLFLIGGCATDAGMSPGAGTVIGGFGGAVVGSQIGGPYNSGVGALIGGVSGAIIGNQFESGEKFRRLKKEAETICSTGYPDGTTSNGLRIECQRISPYRVQIWLLSGKAPTNLGVMTVYARPLRPLRPHHNYAPLPPMIYQRPHHEHFIQR